MAGLSFREYLRFYKGIELPSYPLDRIPFDQIADIPNSLVLADSLEFPIGKKLPLWLIGFLY